MGRFFPAQLRRCASWKWSSHRNCIICITTGTVSTTICKNTVTVSTIICITTVTVSIMYTTCICNHLFTMKLAQPCEPGVRSVCASHAPAWLKKAIVTLDGTPWVWRRLKEDIVVWQPQLGPMVQPCAT